MAALGEHLLLAFEWFAAEPTASQPRWLQAVQAWHGSTRPLWQAVTRLIFAAVLLRSSNLTSEPMLMEK